DDLGVEAAVQEAALPALRRVGTMWETGECDVENEHLITAEMRAWFIALGGRPRYVPPAPSPVVLACGPEDAHSMGLEAFASLLRRRGLEVVMLGPLTPTESFLRALSIRSAPVGVVTSHQSVNRRAATRSIRAAATMPGVEVFFAGGAFLVERHRKGLPGTYLGDVLPAAAEHVMASLP
ncbi:MAG TPA: cobalamin-dependent protein, partial [Actinomycetota bacterium]|nr:cobalamin-dependent protein [Actinomycetota bacterium]